jgi:lysophospholipase L1-like esterase
MTRLVLVLGLLVLLAGCGGQDASGPSAAAPARAVVRSYVALGDSYTSAPYVYLTDVADGCLRSDHDYPSLVARALHVHRFHDASCAGATTRDLTRRQRTLPLRHLSVPPQLRSVGPGTDLVTVGIGGNDFGIFGRLVGCASAGCRPAAVAPGVERSIARLRPRLADVLRLVQQRAPDATVLLIGYPKIAPDRRGCADLPGLSAGELWMLNRLNRLLDEAMRAAARAAGVGYVDVYAASRGHDICAPVPWVNGVHTDTHRAAAMHPFGVEQRAVARLVVARLSR